MGRKAKYSPEQKIESSLQYISGKKSANELGKELEMGRNGAQHIRQWSKLYERYGATIFEETHLNKTYTKEFKTRVINEYLSGKISYRELGIKYKIPSEAMISGWIKRYNNHIEIKDYDPKPEVYMAERKQTSLEERNEIVEYCLQHNRNFKETAQHYECQYSQVRNWVLKFEEQGEAGLRDNRGKRKNENELTEPEKANQKIARLEREKEEFRRRYELLKKAEKRERW